MRAIQAHDGLVAQIRDRVPGTEPEARSGCAGCGVGVLREPLDAGSRVAREPRRDRLERRGLLAAGPPPDAQARCAAELAERLEELMNALGRDMRADVAERERLIGRAGAALE